MIRFTILKINIMEKINEIKLPKGVESISVTQHDYRVVIKFIPKGDEFKNGDFVYEDGRIMIVGEFSIKRKRYHALVCPKIDLKVLYNRYYAPTMPLSSLSFRHATEEEKQVLIDAMKKDGKRWNAEKMCIEDIPNRKFKVGDKVKIKDGVSSKTHRYIGPHFTSTMDEFIGKELTVKKCHNGFVLFNEDDYGYLFPEDWLEPYTEKLKKGDLAIFWDDDKDHALIRIYDRKYHEYHYDSSGTHDSPWKNAIKFESKDQFEKVLRGEI